MTVVWRDTRNVGSLNLWALSLSETLAFLRRWWYIARPKPGQWRLTKLPGNAAGLYSPFLGVWKMRDYNRGDSFWQRCRHRRSHCNGHEQASKHHYRLRGFYLHQLNHITSTQKSTIDSGYYGKDFIWQFYDFWWSHSKIVPKFWYLFINCELYPKVWICITMD